MRIFQKITFCGMWEEAKKRGEKRELCESEKLPADAVDDGALSSPSSSSESRGVCRGEVVVGRKGGGGDVSV